MQNDNGISVSRKRYYFRLFHNRNMIQHYCYHENALHDLCAIHVDHFIHAGIDILEKTILTHFQLSFQIGIC